MPKVFSASLRRFRVHFISILLATAPKAHQAMVSTLDWQVFIQPDAASAQAAWRRVADALRSRFSKAAMLVDQAEADVLAPRHIPPAQRLINESTKPEFRPGISTHID